MITRRRALAVLATGLIAVGRPSAGRAEQVDQWFSVTADDGKPVANMRLPVEVSSEVDELRGVIWIGAGSHEITLLEFFDYNCPYCRKAMTICMIWCRKCQIYGLG